MPRLSNASKRATEEALAKSSIATVLNVFQPNSGGQQSFFDSNKHELILSGGNHSGKTFAGVVRSAYHSIPEKDKLGKRTGFMMNPYQRLRVPYDGIIGWISTHSAQVQRETIQPVVERVFGPYIIDKKVERGTYEWFKTDGGIIFFKKQEATVDSYTGTKLNFAQLDEPHEHDIYNEIKARISMRNGYMWTTLTPAVDPKDPEAWLKARRIRWMKDELVDPWLANQSVFPQVEVIFMDITENKYITNMDFINDLYASLSAEERRIRKTGMFVDFLGSSLFSEDMLTALDMYLKKNKQETTPEFGILSYDDKESDDNWKVTFVETVSNFPERPKDSWIIKVWEHPLKQQLGIHTDYYIGVDAAEGKRGNDYTAVYVKRGDTGAIVAALHGRIDEIELARQLWLLGHYYCSGWDNPAMIAIEVVNVGKVTLSLLVNGNPNNNVLKYPNNRLYRRPTIEDLKLGKHIPSEDYGWYTSAQHRSFLTTAMRESMIAAHKSLPQEVCLIPDAGLVSEAKTFIMNTQGKYEALATCHDDRLFASSIADMAMKQGKFKKPIYKPYIVESQIEETYYYKDGQLILNVDKLRRDHKKDQTSKAVYM